LYGLVLVGGKSSRMGHDKSLLNYHGIPQREYLYNLLLETCEAVFLSLRADQKIGDGLNFISDRNQFQGPYNGLMSAHHQFPHVAWLVLACDLPLMGLDGLRQLIANRDPSKIATAFASKENLLHEPLAAIWEPHGSARAKVHLNNGISASPRKYLINSSIELVFPENTEILLNANSEEEYKKALAKLKSL